MFLMVPAHRPFEVDGIPRLGCPDRLTSGPLRAVPSEDFEPPSSYRGRFPEDCGPAAEVLGPVERRRWVGVG